MPLLLTLKRFHRSLFCFHCWLCKCKCVSKRLLRRNKLLFLKLNILETKPKLLFHKAFTWRSWRPYHMMFINVIWAFILSYVYWGNNRFAMFACISSLESENLTFDRYLFLRMLNVTQMVIFASVNKRPRESVFCSWNR